jgi:hypothetical protein
MKFGIVSRWVGRRQQRKNRESSFHRGSGSQARGNGDKGEVWRKVGGMVLSNDDHHSRRVCVVQLVNMLWRMMRVDTLTCHNCFHTGIAQSISPMRHLHPQYILSLPLLHNSLPVRPSHNSISHYPWPYKVDRSQGGIYLHMYDSRTQVSCHTPWHTTNLP